MWFIHAILLYARHCNHSLWNLGVIRKSYSDFICPFFYMVVTFKLVISALPKWWLLIERKKFFWYLSYGIAFPIQQQKRQPGTVFIVIKLLSYGLKLLRTNVHIFSSLWGGLERHTLLLLIAELSSLPQCYWQLNAHTFFFSCQQQEIKFKC